MSNFLPVLNSQHPANALCSFCPAPGACCKGLTLARNKEPVRFWKDEGIWPVLELLKQNNLPFRPQHFSQEVTDENGRVFVSYTFDCPRLEPSGRCGAYADRPSLCRTFLPASDTLCVFGKMENG